MFFIFISWSLINFFRRKGANRYLTVYKREGSTIIQEDATVKLQKTSKQSIYNLIQKFPLSAKERQELLPLTERERTFETDSLLPAGKSSKIHYSLSRQVFDFLLKSSKKKRLNKILKNKKIMKFFIDSQNWLKLFFALKFLCIFFYFSFHRWEADISLQC